MRAVAATLVIVTVIMLAGCGGTRGPWTLAVRETESMLPAAGVRVQARAVLFYVPFTTVSVHEIPVLNWGVSGPHEAVTSADGTAAIKAPIDVPFELTVHVPFHAPHGVTVDPTAEHPAILEGWVTLITAHEGHPGFEVHLTRTGRKGKALAGAGADAVTDAVTDADTDAVADAVAVADTDTDADADTDAVADADADTPTDA